MVGHLLALVDEADRNRDGRIDLEEWKIMGECTISYESLPELIYSASVAQIKKRVPMAEKHIEKVRDLFQRYDSNGNDSLDMNELALLLQEISSKITALPAVSNVVVKNDEAILVTLHADRPSCFSTRKISWQETDEALAPKGSPHGK